MIFMLIIDKKRLLKKSRSNNPYLDKYNPYILIYKTIHRQMCEQKYSITELKENCLSVKLVMRFRHKNQEDPRRYKNSTCFEFTVVFESADGALNLTITLQFMVKRRIEIYRF